MQLDESRKFVQYPIFASGLIGARTSKYLKYFALLLCLIVKHALESRLSRLRLVVFQFAKSRDRTSRLKYVYTELWINLKGSSL